MFNGLPQGASQIAQGATLYILNRKEFSVDTASVQSVSQPHVSKSAQLNPALALQGFVIDVTISNGGENTTVEFPVNSVSANYPDKGWFISYDKAAVIREIEAMSNASKQFLLQRPWHEKVVQDSTVLLMQLNPEKQIELEQAQKITLLESQLSAMNEKFDKLVGMLSANPANETKEE